ncbi:MAG: DNA polymerase III subunit beta [Gammaproteobacteria bacterium]|nr:DNA polymerase III subunit beta [Gammaproteobacteria bacterium]MDH5727549.1 DNA polymerase III subunit beta [Gammaproteobacteria bacterium]
MKFSTPRDAILRPLQLVSGVVEKRQTLPILSNVLLELNQDGLKVTATDLEMEVIARSEVDQSMPGKITVPVRKLQDTCKTLPDDAILNFELKENKAVIKSGKTRFTLTTMPAEEFPVIDTKKSVFEFQIQQNSLKRLIEKTQFAMAIQDVRYYLNGLLVEAENNKLRAVATDGHRLALCDVSADIQTSEKVQVIIPRKGILELSRLLEDNDEPVNVVIGENYFRVVFKNVIFTTKLIDGKYPNYEGVIPTGGDKVMYADRNILRQCLIRTSILSNEKYRGIRLDISNNTLIAKANNPEQEEAEDEVTVSYDNDALAIGFNVNYLTDAISAVDTEQVRVIFSDSNGSALVKPFEDEDCLYVVMPMRL